MKTSMKFFMALAIVSICLSKCGGSSGEKSAKHSTQSEEMRIKQKIAEMAGEDDDLDEEETSELLAGVNSGYATEESTEFSVDSDSEYNMEEEETSTSSVNNDSEYISDEEQDSSVDGDYILEGSDSRYITEKEVENLSEAERRLAKNEIYARHGRMFDSADLQDYFESKSWYKGTVKPSDFDESVLNKYEKANIDLISSME